jgi:hypothetical protein
MWADIKAKTLELWQMGQDRVKSHFEDGKKGKGVCNNINQFFVEMMHDGNAAELPPTVAALVDTNFEKFFNPFLKLKGQCSRGLPQGIGANYPKDNPLTHWLLQVLMDVKILRLKCFMFSYSE